MAVSRLTRADVALTRRVVMGAALGAGVPALAQVAPTAPTHDPMGPVVPPQPMPPFPLLLHDGRRSDTTGVMRGRVTAVQLMFTGCSGVCPIQGALFAAVAQGIAAHPRMQLLSLTIDPLGDDPVALRRWLDSFGAPRGWLAAAPRVADVDALRRRLGGPGTDGSDAHTRQVHVFDREARLAYRTAELPAARVVIDAMTVVDRMG